MCCLKALTSVTSMSSTRMLNSYPEARMALNMDHAQLRIEDPTAALQQSMQYFCICCQDACQPGCSRTWQRVIAKHAAAIRGPPLPKGWVIEALPLTPVIYLSICSISHLQVAGDQLQSKGTVLLREPLTSPNLTTKGSCRWDACCIHPEHETNRSHALQAPILALE